jgi:hypothetical protein
MFSENRLTPTLTDAESLHIYLLSEQLNTLYQNMSKERKAIALWEEDQDFSILGILELFSAEIQGYAEQVKLDQFAESLPPKINHLRQLNTFSVDYFTKWYFENWQTYPRTKQYVEQLDHLRLVILEYFNQRRTIAA